MTDARACELDHLPDFYCTKCHLPECRAKGLGLWDGMGLCICDELRACEQRVLDAAWAAVESVDDARGHGEYRQGWMDAWDACLKLVDALRAAP